MESTLSLTLTDLAGDVGFFLGYGRGLGTADDPAWQAVQAKNVEGCVKSGLRQFYFPPPLPGEAASYDWSFLKPVAVLPLAGGARTVLLPDDFAGLEGQVTVASTGQASWWPLSVVAAGTILQSYAASPSRTGRPLAASEEWLKPTGPQSGQRCQLRVYPQADQDYTLQVTYYVNPDALTAGAPYPLGGLQHAETIREACLMAAENFLDDGATVHALKFLERLGASVNSDRKMKPQRLGYNGDRSDAAGVNRDVLHYFSQGGIKVNGVQY